MNSSVFANFLGYLNPKTKYDEIRSRKPEVTSLAENCSVHMHKSIFASSSKRDSPEIKKESR